MAPDAGRIHGHGGPVFGRLSGERAADLHSPDRAAFDDEVLEDGVDQDVRTVELGVQHVGEAEPERVHGTVRHDHRPYEGRVHGRLHPFGIFRVYSVGVDPGLQTGFYESLLIVQAETGVHILRKRDEQALRVFHAGGRYLAENHILLNAFLGGFGILHGIAGTAVEQAVVAAGRAGRNVAPLDEQRTEAAQRAVPRGSRSGDAAADDDHIVFLVH